MYPALYDDSTNILSSAIGVLVLFGVQAMLIQHTYQYGKRWFVSQLLGLFITSIFIAPGMIWLRNWLFRPYPDLWFDPTNLTAWIGSSIVAGYILFRIREDRSTTSGDLYPITPPTQPLSPL